MGTAVITSYSIHYTKLYDTSHRYVSKRVCEFLNVEFEKQKIITCHLGNGGSITAIKNGESIDTSMGFTPLEGLVMGTVITSYSIHYTKLYDTKEVIDKMEECIDLAPLHNPPNLKGIYAMQDLLPNVPQVGVFDTAFHQTMPDFAYMYAIPYSLYKKYGIRRYGFHRNNFV